MKSVQDKFNINIFYDEETDTLEILPRATVSVISTTETSMTWKVSSLSYPAKNYDEFEINYYGGTIDKYKSWTSNNSTYNTQVTVTGLKAGTRYTGVIDACYNGKWYTCGSASDYTDEPVVSPPTINSINISSITTNSFYYKISSSLWDYFNVEVYKYGTTELMYASYRTTSTSGTVTGLTPNTQYKIQVSAFNDGGSDYDYEYVTTLTPPQISAPNITITPSIDRVTFSWSRPTGASTLVCTIQGTGFSTTKNFDAYGSPQTVTGLSPNQTYTVWFRYEPSSANSTNYSPSATVKTSFTTGKKPTFYWSTTVKQGYPLKITANDWIKMCDTINEWRALKGYSRVTFTKPIAGVTKISASIFNEAVNALYPIAPSTCPPTVYKEIIKIYAGYFTMFETAINSLNV